MKNEIIIFENQNVKLEVNMKDETVWLTANQMAILFNKDERTIRKHINNVFLEGEIEKNNNTQKMRVEGVKQLVPFYTLDVIISVGYRVNSKNGIAFRRWANQVLKEHLLKGYTVNEKRLEYLEKKVKLIDIATRINKDANKEDIREVLDVINNFSEGLDILDDYDHRSFKKIKGNTSTKQISYSNCLEIIDLLKYGSDSKLFALERNNGLESIINNIYQSFDGKDVYETTIEKASNFLYLVVKNHAFIEENEYLRQKVTYLKKSHVMSVNF